MPAITNFALLALSAASAYAAPSWRRDAGGDYSNCMTYEQAQQVATNWGTLIANYTKELADVACSPNLTDYSESVNTLINECPQGSAAISLPLLAPTFSNLSTFELGQGQQASINFQQLNIWPACNSVVIRWETTNTAPIDNPKPVVGLIALDTVPAPAGNQYPFLISNVYSEFDAGAWLQNLKDAPGICATSTTSSTPAPTSTLTVTETVSAATVTVTETAATITVTSISTAPCVTSVSTTSSPTAEYDYTITAWHTSYTTECDESTVTAATTATVWS